MESDPLWYKDAIIYEVHVRSFFDSKNDGYGDFNGLTEKLDYLHDLGITAIWLLPFFPSPLKDDGYDIADYKNVHPHYGTLADFKSFLKEAHRRNIKVIIELVVNHTSDQHSWFKRARISKENSIYRNYYVWSDSPEKYKNARIIFKDFESSNWTWDPVAKAYYWHRFYSHQPDLNFENPLVQKEILKILDFWSRLGVDGFRLDAVPYLYEKEGTICENLPQTHAFLKQIRLYLDDHFKDRMMIAEANQWPEDAAQYFGNGDECHMAFHFPIMPRLFMAIQLEDTLPIIEIADQTPPIPENCQWALFLRNHDELTLEMVTDEERDYMFRIYASDVRARLNLGIRRRLAPLLKNDRRKIELMNSLLFSLIGTPVLYYGDEIGMGDNIYLGDRNGVRTPMQWSQDRNAGFSKANPQKLYLPPIIDPEYHYEMINVESAQNNHFSLFHWTRQMIALRKKHKVFGRGKTEFLRSSNPKILTFLRIFDDEVILVIANFSRYAQYLSLDLSRFKGCYLKELYSDSRFPQITDAPFFVTLSPYAYYWFIVEPEEKLAPIKQKEMIIEKIPLLSFEGPVEKIFSSFLKKTFPLHLAYYLSYSDIPRKKATIFNLSIEDYFVFLDEKANKSFLILLQIQYNEYETEKIFLFLEFLDKHEAQQFQEKIVSRCIYGLEKEKYLCDLSLDKKIGSSLLTYFLHHGKLKGNVGELNRYMLDNFIGIEQKEPTHLVKKNSQFEIHYEKFFVRIFFIVEEGINIDVEMRLFLSQMTTFRNFLPLVCHIDYKKNKDISFTFAQIIQKSYEQGYNALEYSLNEAERFLEEEETKAELPDQERYEGSWVCLIKQRKYLKIESAFNAYSEILNLLSDCTSQFHCAISSSKEKEFAPKPYTPFYLRSLYQTSRKKIGEFYSLLRLLASEIKSMEQVAKKALERQKDVLAIFENFLQLDSHIVRVRIHGDFGLEHLFFTGKEFLIINFDTNTKIHYNERRFKRNVLRDIAAMLVSFIEVSLFALNRLANRGILNQQNRDAYDNKAFAWATSCGISFLKQYLDAAKETPFLPKNEYHVDFLIGAFFLERLSEKISTYSKTHPQLIPYLLKHFLHWSEIYREFKIK